MLLCFTRRSMAGLGLPSTVLARRVFRHACGGWRSLGRVVLMLALAAGAAGHGPASASERLRWGEEVLAQPGAWYASAAARELAANVLLYQSPQGGFPKSTDLAAVPRNPDDVPPPGGGRANTFDNDATTLPLQFLARVIDAGGGPELRRAFDRGLGYVLQAQYTHGGWPQFFPLRAPGSYYNHVTFNDDAMVNVLTLLQGVAGGRAPYGFATPAQRDAAGASVQRGLALILRTQLRHQGRLIGWCAQYDAASLQPAWARAYEPPSVSGHESAGIVLWLMSLPEPNGEVKAAIEAAAAWFESAAIRGWRYERFVADDGQRDARLVPDPAAGPIWARFTELGTMRPLFMGRDSVPRYSLADIERERRAGYAYYTVRPAQVLAALGAWRARHATSRAEGWRLHLVGDSTMADKPLAPGQPERGWGQLLREQFREPARVRNHAANGRSSKSFVDEGLWARVLAQIEPGDFVLLQFGHNDQKQEDPARHAPARGAYQANLRRFVAQVRERQATPVLATPVVRRKFDADGRIKPTLGDYPQAMREVAAELQVPLLDLHSGTQALLEGLGPDASKTLFMWLEPGRWAAAPQGRQDDTHFVEAGARAVADLASRAIRELKLPLADGLR